MTPLTPPAPAPPLPRGPLSSAVVTALTSGHTAGLPSPEAVTRTDPYGDDLQLALYSLYEQHYWGFAGVDPRREWDPCLLELRATLEDRFMGALRRDVGGDGRPVHGSVREALDALLVEPVRDDGTSVSHYLQRHGELRQLRDYAALRSLYHLKEADPHAWVIPRLRGRAKAGMVAVAYDEFGAGRAEDIHAVLFAELMADLGLNTTYGHYLDAAPAEALATVNLMSLFGLHRVWRGALVGHFASVEVTSSPDSRRLAQAMRRTGAGPAAERFYTEHVEADAVHEQLVRREVIGGLLADEPDVESDVVFGIEATGELDRRLATLLLTTWRQDRSVLRTSPEAPPLS
ncbi:iron-containing redox enzyme family protein [Streptomyces sp. RY43-2]|uniref:Iron-containing redox enzyme family protein n=1 Tax=Streptomyces macrolidinus TaxID=2952607 RepID=A0ABT0ZIY3_9ACTN|nr:iron-containing redox enzyme family protein [Streptomyces macrolidinus]MCN9243506.1 iron-containing redox enzyme family protein [Streptomyces macrolidinus]